MSLFGQLAQVPNAEIIVMAYYMLVIGEGMMKPMGYLFIMGLINIDAC